MFGVLVKLIAIKKIPISKIKITNILYVLLKCKQNKIFLNSIKKYAL